MTIEEKIITILPRNSQEGLSEGLSAAVIARACDCKEDEIIRVIHSLIEKGVDIAQDYPVYGNENEPVYWIAGRSARILEKCFSTFSPAKFYLQQVGISNFVNSINALASQLEKEHAQ